MPTPQPRPATVSKLRPESDGPARAVMAADALEVLRGYLDGLLGEPEPGGNRTRWFQLGWRHGNHDRSLRPEGGAYTLARAIRRLDAACR